MALSSNQEKSTKRDGVETWYRVHVQYTYNTMSKAFFAITDTYDLLNNKHSYVCAFLVNTWIRNGKQGFIKKKPQYHSKVFVIMGKNIKSMDNGFHDFIMH